MSTIPDTLKNISRDIQHAFEELLKLLLRKSLRPTLNPLKANTNIVYNNFRGRYERGFIGSSSEDNINKYSYVMTHDSLGWDGETLANFKVMAKFIKVNTPQRFPAGNTKTYNALKTKAKVAFSEKETKNSTFPQYCNFLNSLTSKTIRGVIVNRKTSFFYTSNIPYTHAFKQLENIGKDIIDQTDPSISGEDSAKMSTSMLRVKLYNLEQDLANLSIDHPNIFDAYVEMLRIINSVDKSKMNWVINIIAALSYQRWEDIPENQRKLYTEAFGEDFIAAFNSNELITILLQSNSSEIIITSAYLYPLMKMLFIVFGYSKLVPIISDKCSEDSHVYRDRLKKHLEKYRGASFRRGDNAELITSEPFYDYDTESEEYDSSSHSKNYVKPNFEPNFEPKDCGKFSGQTIGHIDKCKPNPEPVDQCVYDFIKLFGDLYPTLIGLMGGTEEFPPENIEIGCNDIPANYDCLSSLPEYFWRFNDYSYCRYLEYIGSRQLDKALGSKINAKAKYLQSI